MEPKYTRHLISTHTAELGVLSQWQELLSTRRRRTQLKVSQLQRLSQPDRYLYHENCSKNRAGTFKQLHLDSKVVPIHCTCSSDQQRCHVHILDFYLSKLSPAVVAEEGPFYLRPLSAIPEGDSSPWYTRTPVGRNMLASMLKRMCQRGGIEGHKTNHSLRATGATQLFQAEVPEKIIQERTGHRSLAALRTYERTTSEQHEAVSSLLAARPTVSGPAYINQYRQSKDIQIQQPATSSITIHWMHWMHHQHPAASSTTGPLLPEGLRYGQFPC